MFWESTPSRTAAALGGLFLLSVSAAAGAWNHDRCEHEQQSEDRIAASDLKRLEVNARAGTLEIVGIDTDDILVQANACATSKELLGDVSWSLGPVDGRAVVDVNLPDNDYEDDDYAMLNLVIHVPEGFDLDVNDSSGSIVISHVGAVRLRDGAGSIRLEDAAGPVQVRDGSGSIKVRDVRYHVDIDDGSGSIEIDNVDGSVRLTDNSGSMTIENVSGSVEVERDGSGSISVADVGGNFVVRRDGSGGISHRRVNGEVRIPD